MSLFRFLRFWPSLALKYKFFYLGYLLFGLLTVVALAINIFGNGDIILILIPALLYASWAFLFPMLTRLIISIANRLAISLTIMSFTVAISSPIVLSYLELNVSDVGGESISSSFTHEYVYSREKVSFLETAIAKSNGQTDYRPPSNDLFVKLDIDKVKDIDLSSKTMYLAGKLIGTWVPDSINKTPITGAKAYASSRIKDYSSKDLMKDISFPDMITDDYFIYENLLFNTLKSDSGKDVFVSEYRLAGNFNIVPDFRSYPFDSQALTIQVSHKILPSYMLKIKMLEPTIKLGKAKDFIVGAYKIGLPFGGSSYLKLPYNPQFNAFLTANRPKVSSQDKYDQLLAIEESLQPSVNPKNLSSIKKLYFSLDNFGPFATSKITIPLTRQVASTWLKSVFPASLILLVLVACSYIPEKLVEVRLALPPTILLSLVFMQQSSHAGLPEIPFPILLDYFYMLLFIAAALLLVESILVAIDLKSKYLRTVLAVQRFARYFAIFASSLGMPLIWLIGNAI